MDAEQLSCEIDVLYQSVLEGRLPEFLESIARSTQSNKLFAACGPCLELNTGAEHWRADMGRYLTNLEKDPFFHEIRSHPIGKLVRLSEPVKRAITRSEVSACYRELDAAEAVGVMQYLDGKMVALAMNRGVGQCAYNDAEERLFQILAPHFKRALMLGGTLRQGYSSNQVLSGAVELCQTPLAVVNSELRLLAFNEGFERQLSHCPFLNMRGGRVAASGPLALSLELAVSRGLVGRSSDLSIAGSPQQMRVMPVPRCLGNSLVALVVQVSDQGCLDWCRPMYLLTAKEQKLLEHLSQGLSLKESADKQFVSYHTTRKHLRNLLAKTRTHSQTQLLSTVLRFRPEFSD